MADRFDDTHLALLALFLKPRPLDNDNWQEIWSEALRRPYKKVIAEFRKKGLLDKYKPTFQDQLEALTLQDIKPVLKQHGLKVSGKKSELLTRLVDNLPQEARTLAAKVQWQDYLACTPAGKELAQSYKNRIDADRQATEITVRDALQRGQCGNALQSARAFQSRLPRPMAGMGMIGNERWAQAVLAIQSVPGIALEELAALKLKAAERAIWGQQLAGPKPFLAAAYTAMFTASNQQQLAEYRQSRDIIKVAILTGLDACESCKELAARGPYPLNKVPAIPNPQCTHPKGWCRCSYVAVTKSWAQLGGELGVDFSDIPETHIKPFG